MTKSLESVPLLSFFPFPSFPPYLLLSLAREAALMMFQVNRSISDEMGICANKRNWLDLQKIVSKHIKQLDPKRLNQKQGDFFSKYAESLIGGPICRQSIREVEPETKNVKKEEKVAKPHQVKGFFLFFFLLVMFFLSFYLLIFIF